MLLALFIANLTWYKCGQKSNYLFEYLSNQICEFCPAVSQKMTKYGGKVPPVICYPAVLFPKLKVMSVCGADGKDK